MSQKTIHQVLGYDQNVINDDVRIFKAKHEKLHDSFSREIAMSLGGKPKSISPKFFYDKTGSQLFDRICTLTEYYLTRKETEILNNIKTSLVEHLDFDYRLVELGSGSSTKTKLILDALFNNQQNVDYIPIDISNILEESVEQLRDSFDRLKISGIVDNYENGLEFVKHYGSGKNLIVFLGSSFGNFSPNSGIEFLKRINSSMNDDDLFLIGIDLIKNKNKLEAAYNDSQGVTSQFNLNVLSRINDELGANFDLSQFEHHAVYNNEKNRIEMYLKSCKGQTVEIPGSNITVNFKKDELVNTEYSYKYSLPKMTQVLNQTGFKVKTVWFDKNKFFSLILASKSNL